MKLKTFLYSLAIGLALTTSALSAETGEVIRVGAFCLDEADAKLLAKRSAEAGNPGYFEVMRKADSKCFDKRIHTRVQWVNVILMEKVWSVVNATDKKTYDFWTSAAGDLIGWVWVPAPAEHQPPAPIPTPEA